MRRIHDGRERRTPLRILFLHQFDLDFAGGSGVYLRALSAAMHDMGHRVDVVSAHRPDRREYTSYQLPFDFTLTFGPEKRPGERMLDELSMRELQSLERRATDAIATAAFAEGRPDLVLVNHVSLMAGVALRLAERFDVAYRIISYGTDTLLLVQDSRYIELFSPAARAAEKVFAISDYVANQLENACALHGVAVLGGAVDRGIFHSLIRRRKAAKRIAFIGRLVTEKGVWTLLDAFERQTAASDLDVVGEGPLMDAIVERVAASQSRERIHLLGYRPPEALPAVLGQAAALIVPSIWQEPLGLVTFEAIACGVPVIASAVGGISEALEHGVNGWLVPPGDASSLAWAIEQVVGNPSTLAALRRGCLTTPIPTYVDLAQRLIT